MPDSKKIKAVSVDHSVVLDFIEGVDTEDAEFKDHSAKKWWFAVYCDEKVVSVGSMYEASKSTIRMSSHYTLPEYRGMGCSTAMIKASIDKAKILGYEKADAYTRIPLYKKLGFKPVRKYKWGGEYLIRKI